MWRAEELSRDIVTQQGKFVSISHLIIFLSSLFPSDFYITYLESYGPLAVLIFLRTQNIIKTDRKLQEKAGSGGRFSSTAYACMEELAYPNYGRCHDFIKFLVKVLQFYQGNFELATLYNCHEAYVKLKRLITTVLPSCKELRQILKQKRKQQNKLKRNSLSARDNQFSIYEENIIYIVILLVMESYYL